MSEKEIKTEVIDPEAPVKYLRVHDELNDEEMAMIPWEEAKTIAQAVVNEETESHEPFNNDYYANNPDWYKDDNA